MLSATPQEPDFPPPGRLDPALLAAWLDGRLDEAEAAGLEEALAANPALRETVRELRRLLTNRPAPLNERQVRRLAAIAHQTADWTGRPGRVARCLAAAVLLLAVTGGWLLGIAGARRMAERAQIKAWADTATEFSVEELEI